MGYAAKSRSTKCLGTVAVVLLYTKTDKYICKKTVTDNLVNSNWRKQIKADYLNIGLLGLKLKY